MHAGAGAYICGEETALLDSLEGRRGQPRLKPPFPAVAGLYARPTVVNNVESIASVPLDLSARAPTGSARWAPSGPRASGCSACPGTSPGPGQYEAPLGITLRELLDMAGGMRGGKKLKFWTPGGSSTPLLTDEHLDVPLDFESVRAGHPGQPGRPARCSAPGRCRSSTRPPAWSARPSAGPTSTRTSPAASARRAARAPTGSSRSCTGSSTARATEEDLDKLLDICDNIFGRSFCALGDGAVSPIASRASGSSATSTSST